MPTARPIASGRSRAGSRASPPACAIESKPMNEAKSSADAGEQHRRVSGGASAAGDGMTRERRRSAANVAWSNENPATITTRAEEEGEEHQRHDQALVGLHARGGSRRTRPTGRRARSQAGPVRSRARAADRRRAGGHGDVAQERDDQVRDHADRHAQREPLRERGDEARGTGSGRGSRRRSCRRRAASPRRASRRRGRPAPPARAASRNASSTCGPDAGHVALDHERDDVDAGADHRADAGRDEADQTDAPHQSRACQGRGGT